MTLPKLSLYCILKSIFNPCFLTERIPLRISHQLIFSPYLCSLKHVTSQVSCGEFRVKNSVLCLHIGLAFYCCFSLKICVFTIFIFFFDWVSNFCNRILTTQKPELVIRNCQPNCMNLKHLNIKLVYSKLVIS